MTRAIQVAHFILLVTLIFGVASGIWAGFVYIPQIGSRALTALDGINGALSTVNRHDNGTLAETDKAIMAIKSVTVHADMAIAHEDRNLDKYDSNIQRLAARADELAQSGTRTLDAATESIHAAQTTIKTANDSIASIRPLVAAGTATVKHVDALVTNPAIPETLADLQGVAAHTDAITGDTAKVTAHFEKIIDAPKKRTFWGAVKQGWQIMWQLGMLAK